jgi:hypothetical protein
LVCYFSIQIDQEKIVCFHCDWLQVHDKVRVSVIKHDALNPEEIRSTGDVLCVEWDSDPVADMIADSILTLVLQMESNPAVMNGLSASFPDSVHSFVHSCIRAFLPWGEIYDIFFVKF